MHFLINYFLINESTMILGIDLRCLPIDGSEGAGIAHAARAITRALLESIPSGWSVRLYLPKGAIFLPGYRLPPTTYQILLSGHRRSDLIKGLQNSPCDLLFVPSGAVALNLPVPAIPWVHDVDIYKHPEWFGESWFTRMRTTWMFRRGLINAPMIFVVSEYTGKEIRREGRGARGEIFVTGEGGDESLLNITDEDRKLAKERLMSFGVKNDFILMLGTVEPRKNILFGLWSVVGSQWSESIVVAGKDGWKFDSINQELEKVSSALNVIRIKKVSDALRRDLLISASLILVPSLSEGFGLVALEGIQAGVPVIASDRGALPEIVGDTAIALEDQEAWKLAIMRLMEDDTFRRDWMKRQKEVASIYSWKQSAETIWNSLNQDFQD